MLKNLELLEQKLSWNSQLISWKRLSVKIFQKILNKSFFAACWKLNQISRELEFFEVTLAAYNKEVFSFRWDFLEFLPYIFPLWISSPFSKFIHAFQNLKCFL